MGEFVHLPDGTDLDMVLLPQLREVPREDKKDPNVLHELPSRDDQTQPAARPVLLITIIM